MQDDEEEHGGTPKNHRGRPPGQDCDHPPGGRGCSEHSATYGSGVRTHSAADTDDDPDRERGAQGTRAADEMSDAEWLKALLELNPWARNTPTDDWDSHAFREGKADQFQLRLKEPVNDWNDWAQQMADLRPKHSKHSPYRAKLFFNISALEMHHQGSDLDFRNRTIGGDLICRSALSVSAKFERCQFLGNVIVSSTQKGRLNFDFCQFHRLALFAHTKFESPIFFEGATFWDDADFRDVHFGDFASFRSVKFKREVRFDAARFGTASTFQKAQFHSSAYFSGSTFAADADFCDAKFHEGVFFTKGRDRDGRNVVATEFRKNCAFNRAGFSGRAHFANAEFSRFASFNSIQSKVAFALSQAKFAQTPDFTDATFHEPPRLDDCVIEAHHAPYDMFGNAPDKDPRPPSLLFDMYRRDFDVARDADEHARLRKLRKMAADAKDHENELKFNGYEIAARRFWVDHPQKNPGRFWLGWLYGLLSNYGQAIVRPLVAWVASIVIFWGIIHTTTRDHAVIEPGKCHPTFTQASGDGAPPYFGLGPAGQSFALSFRNALIIERPDPAAARRMYGCLYGLERATPPRAGPGQAANSSDDEMAGRGTWPVIPLSVTLISAVQSIVSAVLLFLLGLGLRNMFRMK